MTVNSVLDLGDGTVRWFFDTNNTAASGLSGFDVFDDGLSAWIPVTGLTSRTATNVRMSYALYSGVGVSLWRTINAMGITFVGGLTIPDQTGTI